MTYLVKLNNASSPTGAAFIGPRISSGFAVDTEAQAYRFEDHFGATRFADHFRGYWRGFAGGASISVEQA